MTVNQKGETPKYGFIIGGCNYKAFFDDMFRFIVFKCNPKLRPFHYLPTGFTPHIGDALVRIMCDNPDFALQARVRQAAADWGWMEAGMEKDRRIGEPILNPYQSLLSSSNPNNYLSFFAKMCEAAKTLCDIGKSHLMWQVMFYALELMRKYCLFNPPEFFFEESARQILGL